MSRSPMIARTIPALRRALDGLRARKATVALVPTMGALHDGHVSLVRLAKRRAKKVVVSIFVNPTQFAPTEDFGSYPRTWKFDIAKLAAEDVDLVWNPDVKVMYPDGFATRIVPEGPATAGLEDRFRPHFFGGVATVVGKLFTQVRPDFAMFGVLSLMGNPLGGPWTGAKGFAPPAHLVPGANWRELLELAGRF